MNNIILGIISLSVVFLLALIVMMVLCGLYCGVETDRKLRALTNEYIDEK